MLKHLIRCLIREKKNNFGLETGAGACSGGKNIPGTPRKTDTKRTHTIRTQACAPRLAKYCTRPSSYRYRYYIIDTAKKALNI